MRTICTRTQIQRVVSIRYHLPGLSLALAALLSVRDEEEAISSPTREETFPGSKASPAACRGAYRPQTVANRPIDSTHADRLHQEGTATRDLADLEEGPEGSVSAAHPEASFSQP